MPDSERSLRRFAAILNEIIEITQLSEWDIGMAAGRSRSQVNQWINGNHLPKPDALVAFTDTLEADYQGPGRRLGNLPNELLAAAGYGRLRRYGETPPVAETPARGFVVDLGDKNERILWEGLDLPRRGKEVLVAVLRAVKSPEGSDAVNQTFDEARAESCQDQTENRRGA